MTIRFHAKLSALLMSFVLSLSCLAKNQYHPIANAGDNQYAIPQSLIKLNASNSTDLDGNRLKFHWKIIAKPKNSTTKINGTEKVAPQIYIDKAGIYQIELWVTDGKYDSSNTVEINTFETQPILPIIHNQKVLKNQTVYVTADKAYDPDGDFLTYDWEIVTKPTDSHAQLSDNTAINTSIVTGDMCSG